MQHWKITIHSVVTLYINFDRIYFMSRSTITMRNTKTQKIQCQCYTYFYVLRGTKTKKDDILVMLPNGVTEQWMVSIFSSGTLTAAT